MCCTRGQKILNLHSKGQLPCGRMDYNLVLAAVGQCTTEWSMSATVNSLLSKRNGSFVAKETVCSISVQTDVQLLSWCKYFGLQKNTFCIQTVICIQGPKGHSTRMQRHVSSTASEETNAFLGEDCGPKITNTIERWKNRNVGKLWFVSCFSLRMTAIRSVEGRPDSLRRYRIYHERKSTLALELTGAVDFSECRVCRGGNSPTWLQDKCCRETFGEVSSNSASIVQLGEL